MQRISLLVALAILVFTSSSMCQDENKQNVSSVHELKPGVAADQCAKTMRDEGWKRLADGTVHGAWGFKSAFPDELEVAAEKLGLELPYASQVWSKGKMTYRLHFSADTKSPDRSPILFWVQQLYPKNASETQTNADGSTP